MGTTNYRMLGSSAYLIFYHDKDSCN